MINDLISVQCEKYCLGGIIKHPEIFPDIDLWVKEDTFGQSTHKVIWSVIRQVLLKGENPTPTLIAQKIFNLNIKTKDDLSIFDYLNAISFSQITAKGTIESFKELIKLKVLRELVCSSEKVKTYIAENKNKDIKEIVSGVDAINNEKIVSLYKNIDEEVKDIFSDVESVIEAIGNNPPDPNSFLMGPFPSINRIYGSLNRPSNVTIIGARSGTGKAQPVWCKVLTPEGWKQIGEIKSGDYVISAKDGLPKKVIQTFPQGKKKYFKVFFDDGGVTYCCDDHLWLTKNIYERTEAKKNGRIRSLKEIRQKLKKKNGKKGWISVYSIPWVCPIQYYERNLPLHPYLMGFLIGDADMCSGVIRFQKIEKDLVKKVENLLPPTDCLRVYANDPDYYHIIRKNTLVKSTGTMNVIRETELRFKKAGMKFIPKDYLMASLRQRLELLQGLMDTDGNIRRTSGEKTFSTTSERLSYDILELVRSLGGRASVRNVPDSNCRSGTLYTVNIWFPQSANIIPVTSIKHLSKIRTKVSKLENERYISNIEECGEDECICILIDSEDHLYITDDYIVTHNTSFAMYHQIYIAEKYKQPLLWLDFGEMTGQELQMRSIVMLTKGRVPYWALESGQWRKNEEWTKIVRENWERVKKIKVYYQDVSTFGPQETISFIRRFAYNKVGRNNLFLVVYDYFKPFETHNYNSPEWKQMGHFLQDIKSFIVNELPIPFWGAIQLNRLGITTNRNANQIDDSENAIGLSDRITQQSSHALLLRFKTMDEIAIEDNRFGNMKLICVKHRHLGKDFMDAIKPIKVGKRFMKNYINLDSGSFYYEDRGDLNQSATIIKEKYDLIEGEKDETL